MPAMIVFATGGKALSLLIMDRDDRDDYKGHFIRLGVQKRAKRTGTSPDAA